MLLEMILQKLVMSLLHAMTVYPCLRRQSTQPYIIDTISGCGTTGVLTSVGQCKHQFIPVKYQGCPGDARFEYLREDALFFRIERSE